MYLIIRNQSEIIPELHGPFISPSAARSFALDHYQKLCQATDNPFDWHLANEGKATYATIQDDADPVTYCVVDSETNPLKEQNCE